MNSPSDGGLEQLQSGMVPAFTVLTDSPEAALIVLSGMGDKWPPRTQALGDQLSKQSQRCGLPAIAPYLFAS